MTPDPDQENTESDPLEYIHYCLGDRLLRIGYIAPGVAVVAEVLGAQTGQFEIDNLYIDRIARSLDAIRLEENEFRDACLKRGIRPPA